jgi:alkylation response protein AidB-like acyl-CoA dehydrogenase
MTTRESSIGKRSPGKALFLGEIVAEQVFPFPKLIEEEAETVRMVIESIDRFMAGKDDQYREFDRTGEQPEEYLEELRQLGLFSLIIPGDHGGLGLSNAAYSRVLQQTSRYDPSTSLTVGAHSSIGMKALLLFGTEAQKAKYLPRLATGELIAAFCLTESGSGSDAASVKTAAELKDDGSWVLNGEKIWITNGGTAGFFTVFARTATDAGKITAFIVEREWAGVSSGPKEDKMGIRASCTTTVRFDNVVLPPEAVLGEVGKGFKVAMAVLNNGRTGLGGGCIGGMKRLIELAANQATQRKQFGKSIAEFGLIQEKLAVMTALCFASESIVSVVAGMIDSGSDDFSVEAAISKIFVSEALWTVGNEALQIAGGNGYMREFPYERMVRDSRINLIFEGTNEILRLYVSLSGFKDAGEMLKGVQKSVSGIFNDPIKGFGVLSQYALGKVSAYANIGRPRLDAVHPRLEKFASLLALGTARFAQAVEAVLKRHGKGIIGQQLDSKRIADCAIELFVCQCTLSRVTAMLQSGASDCSREMDILEILFDRSRRRMTDSLKGLAKNADSATLRLGAAIGTEGRYPWDIV